MSATCILTDSSAQFLNEDLHHYEHLVVVPHRLVIDAESFPDTQDAGLLQHLASTGDLSQITVEAPSSEAFRQALSQLSQKYQNIVMILLSSQLSQAYQNAQQAAYLMRGAASIQVIDSQSIGAGLGMLVHLAVEANEAASQPTQINRLVRGMIPHIYSIFCLQSLNNLAQAGHLDPAQAAIGEMLGIIPFYVLDGGKLVPLQKARSMRQVVDILHEFVTEFEQLDQIALLHGTLPYEQELNNLRERLEQDFAGTPIRELAFGAAMTVMFGPRSLGIAVQEHAHED